MVTSEVELALLKQEVEAQSKRLSKVEEGIDGIRSSINRGLAAVCVLLGGTLANLIITISHVGKPR